MTFGLFNCIFVGYIVNKAYSAPGLLLLALRGDHVSDVYVETQLTEGTLSKQKPTRNVYKL
jgi:hypothetical protein